MWVDEGSQGQDNKKIACRVVFAKRAVQFYKRGNTCRQYDL